MSRNQKGKGKKKRPLYNEGKSALDALNSVKKLQTNMHAKPLVSETQAVAVAPEESAGSNDINQNELTGGSLQWYEKYHDEKINNVETRLGAQTTEMILDLENTMNEKISSIKEKGSIHTITIVVTIIVGFVVFFLGFYLTAIEVVEKNVESNISRDVKSVEDRVVGLGSRIEKLENDEALETKQKITDDETK